jgi:predicted aspartyl protease
VKTNKLQTKSRIVNLACLAILAVACTSARTTSRIASLDSPPAQQDSKSFDYRFASGSSAKDIPFELNANKIYLSVRVNEKGPLSFILDSGAAFDVLDTEQAKALNMKLSDETTVRGAGEGSVQTAVGTGLSLSLKGLEILKPSITILPIHSSISNNEGRAVDGLLGYDFFKHFVVEIDYARNRINIYEPKTYQYAGRGKIIPLAENRGHIFINSTLVLADDRQLPVRLLVDTGAKMAVMLNTPFVNAQKLIGTTPQIDSVTGIGVGGEYRSAVARIESLGLGPFTIKEPVITLSRSKTGVLAGADYDGIIGAEILRRFKVIIDYSRQQMIVEPNKYLNEAYKYDMSGLVLIAEGPSLKTYKINQVLDRSPAAESGLQKDDLITFINGQPAANFTLEQIRQMFTQQAGMEYKLGVRRNEQSLTVVLKLRKLI